MLKKDFFNNSNDYTTLLQSIYRNIHLNGAISLCELETLSILKYLHNDSFRRYEPHFMYAMGLFYKTNEPQSFIDLAYGIYAETIKQTCGVDFTPVQADIFRLIRDRQNFSFSAPTSTGKSFLFRAVLQEANGDIVVIVPSRALLAEYLIRIREYAPKDTLVLPFIELINTKKTTKRIFVVTPERSGELFKLIDSLNVKLILFDEAQLSDEGIRGMRFDSFVRRVKIKLPSVTKVFAHPFVSNPEAQLQKHGIEIEGNYMAYKQNNVGKIFVSHKNGVFKFFSPYNESANNNIPCANNPILDTLNKGGTCLIYISKASIFDQSFLSDYKEYIDLCSPIKDISALELISELEEYLGVGADRRSLTVDVLKLGIVLHHGSMPLKARSILEKFVNQGYAKMCFATSTLIQGINMPFDLVWVRNFKFTGLENVKILNIKNLIGRAGRSTTINNSLDYGIVVIEYSNISTFCIRLRSDAVISNISLLDEDSDKYSEDYKDNIEAIQNDTFSDEYNLPQIQVDRLSSQDTCVNIEYILNNLLPEGDIVSAKQYYEITDDVRDKIKLSFKEIYVVHLRRGKLETGEQCVLSASIPILLWQIQGKSFAEIVRLRYNYLSQKKTRSALKRQLKNKEISEQVYQKRLRALTIPFSNIAHQLPDSKFKKPVPLFDRKCTASNVDFDKVIYDTYDYIDKVISFSLKDPLCAACKLFFDKYEDPRAISLSNYIEYGTDNDTEIWLIKYGFSFEDIEWLLEYVENINSDEIIFKPEIKTLQHNKLEIIERYL